jgi:uncharacterized protein YceK
MDSTQHIVAFRTVAFFRLRPFATIMALAMAVLAPSQASAATSLSTLYQFAGSDFPAGSLAVSATGTFYGVAQGTEDDGSIFTLAPDPKHKGKYIKAVLHAFAGGPSDGATPHNIILAPGGAIYGSTARGGHSGSNCDAGCGTVFELTPPTKTGAHWQEKILHYFSGGPGGYLPSTNLVFDQKGRLYGVTASGGSTTCGTDGCGTIFQLTKPTTGAGAWRAELLDLKGSEGPEPVGIAIDKAQNLYITTELGGGETTPARRPRAQPADASTNCGNFLGLDLPDSSKLPTAKLSVIQVLLCAIADSKLSGPNYPAAPAVPVSAPLPKANLAGSGDFDLTRSEPASSALSATELIGAATGGGVTNACADYGNNGCGVVYALIKSSSGKWITQILYRFKSLGDGADPANTLVQDKQGNIYGTTLGGGIVSSKCPSGCGTVFELAPPKSGTGEWTKVFTHKFTGGADGSYPMSDLIVFDGSVYGTTEDGGDLSACRSFGCGTFFRITP